MSLGRQGDQNAEEASQAGRDRPKLRQVDVLVSQGKSVADSRATDMNPLFPTNNSR
jgi:hypothetical protein